jgi:hypothetical protein
MKGDAKSLETHWRASAVLSTASSAAGIKRTRSCSPTTLPSSRQADNFFFFSRFKASRRCIAMSLE